MTQKPNAVQILLPIPSGKAIFDYALPSGQDLHIGDFVLVSFRKKEVVGVVWAFVVTEIPLSKIGFEISLIFLNSSVLSSNFVSI